MRRRALDLVALAAFSLGCGGAGRGTLVALPTATAGGALAQATTSEADGLRVLWHGPTRGRVDAAEAWSAASPSELEDLWQAAGRPPPAPRVDFRNYVVFGIARGGGVCPDEITGARREAGGLLSLQSEPLQHSCVDLLTRVAEVVAVPRRLLDEQITLVSVTGRLAFQFRIQHAARTEGEPNVPLAEPSSPAPLQLGEVALPERGHMALATLSDGTEVWVVHHANGDLGVLSASVAVRDTNYFEIEPELDVAPAWDASSGRFRGGYDAYGRNVHGWTPLTAYHFTASDAHTLRVDGLARTAPGAIEPATAAPELAGTRSVAYADRSPRDDFAGIPLGRVEALQADVVWGTSGPARLCRAPSSAAGGFTGCAEGAPAVEGSPARVRSSVLVLEGPVMVRRQGFQLARVTIYAGYELRTIVPK